MLPSPQELLAKIQGGSSASLFGASPQPTQSTIPSPQELLSKTQAQTTVKPVGQFKIAALNTPSTVFARSLLDSASTFISNAATKIKSFVGARASDVGVALSPTGSLDITPADVLTGVKKTAEGIGTGIKSIAEGFNEGVERIVKSSVAAVAPGAIPAIGNIPGARALQQAATGQTSVPTYQDIYSKANDYALNNNADIHQAGTFAGLAVMGSLFADNPLVGPEKEGAKGLFTLTEDATKVLANTTDESAIKDILKTQNPGITDTMVDAITPVFRNAATEDEVRAAADQITKINQAAKDLAEKKAAGTAADAAAEDTPPTPDDLFETAKRNTEPSEPFVPTEPTPAPYMRAIADDAGKTSKFIPVEGQPVKIMDGLETFVHQPEKGGYEVMEASTGRMIGTPGATVEEAVQNATAALGDKTLPDVQKAIQKHDLAPRENPIEDLPTPAAQQPFDRNVVRSISQEEQPGPIVDTLKGQFPNLSENALGPIADRLASLHRTGDIEGILQVVRNIDSDIAASRKAGSAIAPPLSREALDKSIAKVGEAKALAGLPASIGELMTSAERGRYLDNVSRVIKNPEQAVLAQQEYDALWEHADQRIIDRYEELKTYRDIMRDTIDVHPGRSLNSLYKGTFKSPDDVQLDELVSQKKGKGLDVKIQEIMGDSGGDAQKALDDFREMRTHLAQVEAEMRELKPKVRAARILQTMIEDVPIITRKHAGEIEALAGAEDVRSYKDISGFMGQARDVYRNFEAVFGDAYPKVKKVILDPFDKSKGEFAKEVASLGDRVEENIIKKYGIERGSKESEAVQLYGEGKLSHTELIAKVGSDKVKDVIDSVAWFRKEYDRLLDEVNAVRARIFPNDPSKLIPKRKDYFRHFEEMSDGFRELISLFESPAGIDPTLAGLSEWTKPKSKFLSFAQERVGKSTNLDAVGGFLNYAPTFAYAKHIDQHISSFRYLRRRLADNAPVPDVLEKVPVKDAAAAAMGATELVKQKGINNFLEYLDEFANNLAGKTNPMDRYIQKIVPGGRKTFKVIDWLNARVKANTILGNLSSSVAQIFNVPQGIASAKLYSLPGIQRTLSSILVENEPIKASAFISERYMGDLKSRFQVDWVDHPIVGTSERGKAYAAWITGALDELGTKFIWNAHYAKGVAEGAADPIKYADDITREMVAGRGIGEVPLAQQSKLFQLIAPFQLEVGNLWFVQGKFLRKKDFGALATLFVANYLFNQAAKAVRGTPVTFDPIESLIDGATQASDEMQDTGNPARAALKFVGRQVGELLSNVPGGQTVAEAVPDSWVQGTTQKLTGAPISKQEIFGSADPGRFGGGLISINGFNDPLGRIIPPFGGVQVERTIGGIESMLKGQVTDSKGQLSFKTTPTFTNVLQATLFGKNATSDAQAYYDAQDQLFNRTYGQTATRTSAALEAESEWAKIKVLPKDQAISALQDLNDSDPTLAAAVVNVGKQEKAGLDGTDRLVAMLGVDNGERAKYITEQLNGMKSKDDKLAYVKNLNDKGLLTATVFKQVQSLIAGPAGTPTVANGQHKVSGILNTVITYADALGTDPVTAFNRIFTGQTIERVDNGTIIVDRMPFDASEAVKKEDAPGGYNGMNLDHTIPLELGGSNDKSNLKLVSEATWASYTPVENLLGAALRSKQISKATAQDLITRFKAGEITADDVQAQVSGTK